MAIKLGPLGARAEAEAKAHPSRLKYLLIGAALAAMLVAGAGAGVLEALQGGLAQASCGLSELC